MLSAINIIQQMCWQWETSYGNVPLLYKNGVQYWGGYFGRQKEVPLTYNNNLHVMSAEFVLGIKKLLNIYTLIYLSQ